MQQQQVLMQTQPTEDALQGLQHLDLQQPDEDLQQPDSDDLQQPDAQEGEAGADLLGGRAAAPLTGLDSPGAQSGSDTGSGSEADGKAELARLLAQRGIKHGTAQGQQLARLLQGGRAPAAGTPDALKVRAGRAAICALLCAPHLPVPARQLLIWQLRG